MCCRYIFNKAILIFIETFTLKKCYIAFCYNRHCSDLLAYTENNYFLIHTADHYMPNFYQFFLYLLHLKISFDTCIKVSSTMFKTYMK